MSKLANPPELIISLSRDTVGLWLLDQPSEGITGWRSTFPVQGVFMEDQISNALDTALHENPSLIDHFKDVAVVVVDRPNVLVPNFYADDKRLTEIATRYLRIRQGDILSSDATEGGMIVAYSIPAGTIGVVREYYANAGPTHLVAILWHSICKLSHTDNPDQSRLFFFVTGNTLIILGETAGKLTFTKNFFVQDNGDLTYYALACSQVLKSKENWIVTIADEPSSIEIPRGSYFQIHNRLELPALHTLIAEHKACVS